MVSRGERRLLRESRAARAHVKLIVALGALSALLIVAQAALLAYVIDRAALGHVTVAALTPQLLALAGVLVARAATDGGFELSARLGASGAMSELRGRLADHALRAGGAGEPAGQGGAELAAAAVQGVDALQAYFAGYLPQLVLAALVPLAVLAWAASADPLAAGILALTIPVLITFMILIGAGARAQARRRWQALSLLGGHFLDVVRGLATLRAHRRERAQEKIIADVGERYRRETMATLRIAFLSALVLELCAMIGTAMAAAAIGVQLAGGYLDLTAGLTVLLLAPELYAPLRQVGQQFHAAADGTAAAERIYAALDRPAPLARARAGSRAAPARARRVPDPAREAIRLSGVRYEYPKRAGRALDGIDLELAPGQITALVGPSGAGKSTIARLIMRLADPLAGRVTCGGVDLRELDPERWREQIAWVPQRPQLFSGTVADNIRLGAPDAGVQLLRRAARMAGAQELIERLPDGLQTRVGASGRRLSAGQRQRIALARAIVASPRLLVLDEPAAHLDEASVRGIGSRLAKLSRGRTTLLIVHHPALAEHAAQVLRVAGGRLAGAGGSARRPPRAVAVPA
jgi:ATP-binding cassette, subfamily C, bacterial CydD